VISLLAGSRLFLGFNLQPSGGMDILTSLAMMLLVWFLIARISHATVRNSLLALAGLFFIFFHLVCGLHYRFFNVHIPYDIYRQWSDIFVVGSDGIVLMTTAESFLVVVLPAALLLVAMRVPVRAPLIVFAALAAVISIGWVHRLSGPVDKPVTQMEALPAYLHRLAHTHYTFWLGRDRFRKSLDIADELLAIDASAYERSSSENFMQTPLKESTPEDTRKYNVILIIAESVRAYECGFMGAQPGVTPQLDTLSESARVYTNFYANGSQTVAGEMAILCSVYPNPYGTPAYLTNPRLNVVSLLQILKQYGYTNYWLSGYTADFHNKRKFLSAHGVDHIIDRDVLPKAKETIGWGMSDVEMFEHAARFVETLDAPFFLQITTLSNHYAHGEFPVAVDTPESSNPQYKRYLEGTAYTDTAIGSFLRRFLDTQQAENTIVIVTGDHGLWIFPEDVQDYFKRLNVYFRTPLLVWGPEAVVTAGRDDTIGSHVNVAPTLLDMLNIRSRNTFFGRSLLDKSIDDEQRFAFCLMGSMPFFRQGDNYVISPKGFSENSLGYFNAEDVPLGTPLQEQYTAVRVKGDVLHENCQIERCSSDTTEKLSEWIEAMKFISGYCIYFDRFVNDG